MVAKKGNRGGEEAEEELTRVPLQAVLLADSFATLFRPITLERPKVLLPLVNTPMIEYTLGWLESAGVEEVFVFCCAHAKQIVDYLENSNWFGQPNFSVTTIESHNSTGAGDALRLIYERHVIRGDFILVTGDTVSNMSLTQALKEHKDRRKKDSNAVMTMAIRRSKSSPITRQSRLGTEELFMAIDPDTKQLVYYEDKADNLSGRVFLDKVLLIDNSSISLHNDKQDCYIDICSPEVLSLFMDNFDYQHLRRDFVKGLLLDDTMCYKIFTHEINSSYAARVDNFRSYDAISKDIIQRWTYPWVPDIQFFGECVTKHERQGLYRASDVEVPRSARIGPFTAIGSDTRIGNYTEVSNSVIGEGCVIGSNVSIDGCYIWNNVSIEDGCKLKHAIVCDGVIMKSGAVLEPGVVLSFKVIIGHQFAVPSYSKVSLFEQPVIQDSDEELEYAGNSSRIVEIPSISNSPEALVENLGTEAQIQTVSEVGIGGAGNIWCICEGDYDIECRHSVAPIPAVKIDEILKKRIKSPPSTPDSGSECSVEDDYFHFQKEVEATFRRTVDENVNEDHAKLEVNSLRLAYNLTATDCASALFYSMMKLALDTPHSKPGELVKNVASVITKCTKLLKYYLSSIDEEIEVILKFEEMCLESTMEYSSLFKQILHLLYEKDIIREDAILRWAKEKEEADESDKVFLRQAEQFIKWLKEAEEEEEDE